MGLLLGFGVTNPKLMKKANPVVSVQAPWVDLLKLRLADSPRFC